MNDKTEGQGYFTRLSHAGRAGTNVRGFVNVPVHRGSTMLYGSMSERTNAANERFEQKAHYGTGGSATHWALENVVAEIEGGTRCQISPPAWPPSPCRCWPTSRPASTC